MEEYREHSKRFQTRRTACREGTSFDLFSQNKENGGREQGKGFQKRKTACRRGNN
jgi:hypothetical protein